MEDQVAAILLEERLGFYFIAKVFEPFIFVYLLLFSKFCSEERALRKAEMEATKVFHPTFM